MTATDIIETIRQEYPEVFLADGFEDAIIGLVEDAARGRMVFYDYDKCVEILMNRDGLGEEAAEEYMDFNVTGAYVGANTPLFLHNWR